jgi:hypothetical protein
MASGAKRRRGFIVSIVGILIAVLGVLWVIVIFPWLEKVPSDFYEALHFDAQVWDAQVGNISMDIHRDWTANGTRDGALLVAETITFTNTETGEDMSDRYSKPTVLAIDRKTRRFVPEVDKLERWGQWSPPPRLGKGDSFDQWIPAANMPLEAKYVREEDFRGLKVVVFRIEAEDISLGPHPEVGYDSYLTEFVLTMWIEPESGAVVDEETYLVRSMDIPILGGISEVYRNDLRFSESAIDQMMDTARHARWMLFWTRTIIPWVCLGVGALLVILDLTILERRRRNPRPQKTD